MTDYSAWHTFTLPHTDFAEAHQWCGEQFDQGVELDCRGGLLVPVRFYSANLRQAWWQRWGATTNTANHWCYFLFRDENDAVLFKLRWSP